MDTVKFIDAHVHIHPDPKGFGPRFDASLKALLSNMEELPLEKVVILPIAPEVSNSFVHEACIGYPGKLIGFASTEIKVNHGDSKALIEEIEKYNLKGLKLHPRMQGFGVSDYKSVLSLLKDITAAGLPIVIDSFPYGDGLFKDDSLELIDSLARDLPEARIIMAHAGGVRLMEAFLVAMKRPNILLDISFILFYFKGSSIIIDLEFMIKKLGSKRFVYGSDSPQVDMKQYYLEAISMFERLCLDPEEVDDIMSNNVGTLLDI